jgi:hypothetical protein
LSLRRLLLRGRLALLLLLALLLGLRLRLRRLLPLLLALLLRLDLLLSRLARRLRLLPIRRRLACGRRQVGAALRRARRPVAETAALVCGERLRRLHPIGGAHHVLRPAKRSLRTEVAAAQILRPHLHGARDRRSAR